MKFTVYRGLANVKTEMKVFSIVEANDLRQALQIACLHHGLGRLNALSLESTANYAKYSSTGGWHVAARQWVEGDDLLLKDRHKKAILIVNATKLTHDNPTPNIHVPVTLTGESKVCLLEEHLEIIIGDKRYWVLRNLICDEPEYVMKAWSIPSL